MTNELQEKLDWLEENHYYKFEGEYRKIFGDAYECRFTAKHVIDTITVHSAPLGMLKASHKRWLESVQEELKPKSEKEIEVEVMNRETFHLRNGKSVYILANVTVKQNGNVVYKIAGEFKFENHPSGDMKYYEEVIRGSFL